MDLHLILTYLEEGETRQLTVPFDYLKDLAQGRITCEGLSSRFRSAFIHAGYLLPQGEGLVLGPRLFWQTGIQPQL